MWHFQCHLSFGLPNFFSFIHSFHPVLPSIHPSVRPSIHPSIRPSVRPSIHPSIIHRTEISKNIVHELNSEIVDWLKTKEAPEKFHSDIFTNLYRAGSTCTNTSTNTSTDTNTNTSTDTNTKASWHWHGSQLRWWTQLHSCMSAWEQQQQHQQQRHHQQHQQQHQQHQQQ